MIVGSDPLWSNKPQAERMIEQIRNTREFSKEEKDECTFSEKELKQSLDLEAEAD